MRYFRLQGGRDTLVFASTDDALPCLVYYGPSLDEKADLDVVRRLRERSLAQAVLDIEEPLSCLPEPGRGFLGWPGLSAHRSGGEAITQLVLEDAAEGPDRLVFVGSDSLAGLRVTIELILDAGSGVVSSNVRVDNEADTDVTLDWVGALCLPVPERMCDVLSVGGRWGDEFHVSRRRLDDGLFLTESRRGRGSHHSFPGLALCEGAAGQDAGEVVALHLGWSGNHRLLVERLADGRRQVQAGELPMPGELTISPGHSYQSPTVYVTRSDQGLNGVRGRFHRFVRSRILPPHVAARPRPVHFDTWDALRFDHDGDALAELVDLAADVGVERFVLDDGWFVGRDDDTAGLGDWFVCERKYPDGLRPLADAVRSRGMEFGLWFEPEMINPDSELYRAHPDWVLGDARREQPTGRNQYALDLTRRDVNDYLFDRIVALVEDVDIAYIKWDMNRDLLHAVTDGRPSSRRQTLAMYALIDRLRTRLPSIEIEACSSGGARADFEILKRTERVWVSDCHDPSERQRMHEAFSLFFPPEVMGAHVGPRECSVTRRRHSTFYKCVTASFGHFGVEADLRELDEEELEVLRRFISLYSEHRDWLHEGTVRYLSDEDGPAVVRCCVSPDRRQALIGVAVLGVPRDAAVPALRIPGLLDDAVYRLTLLAPDEPAFARRQTPLHDGESLEASGSMLADVGVVLPLIPPDNAVLLQLSAL